MLTLGKFGDRASLMAAMVVAFGMSGSIGRAFSSAIRLDTKEMYNIKSGWSCFSEGPRRNHSICRPRFGQGIQRSVRGAAVIQDTGSEILPSSTQGTAGGSYGEKSRVKRSISTSASTSLLATSSSRSFLKYELKDLLRRRKPSIRHVISLLFCHIKWISCRFR